MVNKSIIPHLKSCCLALGLTKKDDAQPFRISGSGFFIDPDGFFVTVDHVALKMVEGIEYFKKKGTELESRGFWFENTDENHGRLLSIKIEHGRTIKTNIPELNEFFPDEQDLFMGRLSGTDGYPFLNFFEPTKFEVFDEIFMCGYPRGKVSLRTQDQSYGDRLSPILQYGHIASLLPVDYSQNPFGIQTDIIGTTGSSGSPIVDANTMKVLGIAQNVIPSKINSSTHDLNGIVKMGLTWGISNYFIADVVKSMLIKLKSEFDKDGRPLKDLPEKIELTDTFQPNKFVEKTPDKS